jgi:hypothetical protein
MVRKPPDLVSGLLLDASEELLVRGRILGACENELLPDQDALLVANLVEIRALIESARPDTEQVAVGLDRLYGKCQSLVVVW